MELLAGIVCRPRRAHYKLGDLGPAAFCLPDGTRVNRVDRALDSAQNAVLQCSHYVLEDLPDGYARVEDLPVVVYCHGNGSSRTEADDCIDYILPRGMSLFCFDFSGSGLSTGDTSSMGIRESRDLSSVLRFLKSTGHRSIGVWGRSMGAVASLMAASSPEDRSLIDGLILDSCFLNLEQVASEIAASQIKSRFCMNGCSEAAGSSDSPGSPETFRWTSPAPGSPESHPLITPVADAAVSLLRTSVLSEVGFDIRDCDPGASCHLCECRVMFVAANEDRIVRPHHTIELFGRCSNAIQRELVFVSGSHNSTRPNHFKAQAAEFLRRALLKVHADQDTWTPQAGRVWNDAKFIQSHSPSRQAESHVDRLYAPPLSAHRHSSAGRLRLSSQPSQSQHNSALSSCPGPANPQMRPARHHAQGTSECQGSGADKENVAPRRAPACSQHGSSTFNAPCADRRNEIDLRRFGTPIVTRAAAPSARGFCRALLQSQEPIPTVTSSTSTVDAWLSQKEARGYENATSHGATRHGGAFSAQKKIDDIVYSECVASNAFNTRGEASRAGSAAKPFMPNSGPVVTSVLAPLALNAILSCSLVLLALLLALDGFLVTNLRVRPSGSAKATSIALSWALPLPPRLPQTPVRRGFGASAQPRSVLL